MNARTNTHVQAQRHSNLELDQDVVKLLDPEKKPDPEGCAQDLIDFSPVYRCLHIHSVLVSEECARSQITINSPVCLSGKG